MPFPPLLKALKDKTKDRVIISDENFPEAIKMENRTTNGSTDLFHEVVIHNDPR